MPNALFVTGTDTEIGKTLVCVSLMGMLIRRGFRVAGMKPVASGCVMTAQGLRNDDALWLQRTANVDAAYEAINPYAFAPPIAPHLAAREAGVEIDLHVIQSNFATLGGIADWVVVEGIGGWRVPLGAHVAVADLAAALQLPVILVVGMRLGCLNHALLTVDVMTRMGVDLVGWIANLCDPRMDHVDDNVQTLRERITAPLLARIPYQQSIDPTGIELDIAPSTLRCGSGRIG